VEKKKSNIVSISEGKKDHFLSPFSYWRKKEKGGLVVCVKSERERARIFSFLSFR